MNKYAPNKYKKGKGKGHTLTHFQLLEETSAAVYLAIAQ